MISRTPFMPVPSAGWHAAGTDPSAADWTGGGAGAGFGRSFLHHRVSPGPAAMLSFTGSLKVFVAVEPPIAAGTMTSWLCKTLAQGGQV